MTAHAPPVDAHQACDRVPHGAHGADGWSRRARSAWPVTASETDHHAEKECTVCHLQTTPEGYRAKLTSTSMDKDRETRRAVRPRAGVAGLLAARNRGTGPGLPPAPRFARAAGELSRRHARQHPRQPDCHRRPPAALRPGRLRGPLLVVERLLLLLPRGPGDSGRPHGHVRRPHTLGLRHSRTQRPGERAARRGPWQERRLAGHGARGAAHGGVRRVRAAGCSRCAAVGSCWPIGSASWDSTGARPPCGPAGKVSRRSSTWAWGLPARRPSPSRIRCSTRSTTSSPRAARSSPAAPSSYNAAQVDVRADYQREVDRDTRNFVSERAALSLNVRPLPRWSIESGADYDLANTWFNNADATVRYTTPRITVSGDSGNTGRTSTCGRSGARSARCPTMRRTRRSGSARSVGSSSGAARELCLLRDRNRDPAGPGG